MTGIRATFTALLAFGLCGCSAERNPLSPTGPDHAPLLLAFVTDRPPSQTLASDILFYDLRGSGPAYYPENVNTPNTEGESFPAKAGDGVALSGDGHYLAFNTNRLAIGTTASMFLYDVAKRQLLSPPRGVNRLNFIKSPSLSGNGRFLAVQYQIGPSITDQFVAVEDLVANSLLALPNLNDPSASNSDPSLNGDGALIAFASNRMGGTGASDIYLYSVPGDSLIPLPGLNSSAQDSCPSISADGRYVAFQSGRSGGTGLGGVYLYDRVTASLVPLPTASDTLSEVHPAISPDGRYLAYTTESAAGRDLWIYDIRAQHKLRVEGLNHPLFSDYAPCLASLPAGAPRLAGSGVRTLVSRR